MFKRRRSLPEFWDFQSALSDLQGNEDRLTDAESRLFGMDYQTFAGVQPKELSISLKDFSSAGKGHIRVCQDISSAGATLPGRLQQLAAPDAIEAAKDAFMQILTEGLGIDAENRCTEVYILCELIPEMNAAVVEFKLTTHRGAAGTREGVADLLNGSDLFSQIALEKCGFWKKPQKKLLPETDAKLVEQSQR
jgi:hypothetical protein